MRVFITICSPTATAKDIATAIRWARLRQLGCEIAIRPYEDMIWVV